MPTYDSSSDLLASLSVLSGFFITPMRPSSPIAQLTVLTTPFLAKASANSMAMSTKPPKKPMATRYMMGRRSWVK